ncbi:MAG TPA: GNAT family protein [Candidatus Limnocylindrales bacterium]
MELHGRQVTLRPTVPADAPALSAILAEPEVARWWGDFDLDRVVAELIVGDPDEIPLAIEREGVVIGYIQAVEENAPDFRSAGIDLFLRTRSQGRGLGPDAIRTLAAYLVDERGHHRLTIDPAADNERAIAAYAKIGFRPVGLMRQYQRLQDRRWVDALLMDLLADELVR